ncbi:MAG TPA: glycosyltransferase family 4 protein [Pyrinomonadaceae bacterium]|nr:glycosyltransferase family 4 protein [Pyrinomonadaceae bacterium]
MDELFILQAALEIGFGGGSECVAYELYRSWLSHGIDSRVVTGQTTEPAPLHGITLVVPWLKSWAMRTRWRHLAALIVIPLCSLAVTWRVWRTRGQKIVMSHGDSLIGDVCVVHAVNRACLAAKRKAGYYGWMINPINLWVAWRDRWMLGGGRHRKLVAISERVRMELKEYYHVPDDRIVTIPNGINLARFSPRNAKSRAKVRLSFGIPHDVPLVLFVGSRYRIKGLKFAIKALAEMETTAYLLVVGDDGVAPFRRLADQLGLGDRVIFAGARNNLPAIYPAADAFLLPTLYETFALVCLEAMASGLPVLASPVGGIEDYLRDNVNGFHIQNDPTEIAAKLDRLLTNPQLQERIRAAGLATARNYSWDKIADQYLALFDELIAEKAAKLGTFAQLPPWRGTSGKFKNAGVSV